MIKPLTIGNFKLENNIFLAPMAGIADKSFRALYKNFGVGLVYSEMISAAGLSRRDKKTFQLMEILPQEQPLCLQLFGNKPEEFAKSARIISQETDAAFIDINMGCPVRKVVSHGSGSALMQNLELALDIVSATLANTNLPVTIKVRSGWDTNSENYLELSLNAAKMGVAAIALHPRTRQLAFKGKADWTKIKILKDNLHIPIIGSGDINTLQDAQSIFKQTNCDATMLGRGVMGNPWLIKSIVDNQEYLPTIQERIAMYLKHTRFYLESYPQYAPVKSIREMRKFAHRYISGFTGAAKIRQEINLLESYPDIEKLLQEYL